MHINIGPKNMAGLLDPKVVLSVPSFQRNYSWTKDELNQFLSDIYETAKTDEPHFWGPVVLLRLPNEKALQIIDGQQRITTAIMFLSILRDHACQLKDKIMNPGTPGFYDLKQTIRNILFIPPILVEPKFEGSYLTRSVLRKYVLADPVSPGPDGVEVIRPKITPRGQGMTSDERMHTKTLRAAWIHINGWVARTLESAPEENRKYLINDLYRAAHDLFELHSMELSTEDDAYTLFETLNNRGLRLNPSDLLKTHTLKEISVTGDPASIQNALDTWDEMLRNMGDFDFSSFLRHYLLTRTNSPVQKNKIFGAFKEEIRKLGNNGSLQNLNKLKAASDFYANLLDEVQHPDSQLRASFVRMNGYSDTHRVFLLGMLQLPLSLKDQQTLTRSIEVLSFRWIAAGRNAQELETLYQHHLHQLSADLSPANIKRVIDSLISAAPSDAQLEDLTSSDSIQLQRYVLRRIEASTGGAIAGVPDVEHLAPQNPPANDSFWHETVASPTEPDQHGFIYDDYVRNWGNLTLLEDKLNKSIKNAKWKVKTEGQGQFKGISASNYNINSRIRTLDVWTGAEILDREKWIRAQALALASSNWALTGKDSVTMWGESV